MNSAWEEAGRYAGVFAACASALQCDLKVHDHECALLRAQARRAARLQRLHVFQLQGCCGVQASGAKKHVVQPKIARLTLACCL